MKPLCRTLLCASLLLCGGAWAGTDVDAAIDLGFERSQINSQRGDWSTWLLRQQQVCEQRFAVSACLTSARRQQRAALDELRRREILLNDLERQNQAIDALQRIESNLAQELLQRRHAELLQEQQAQSAVPSAGDAAVNELNPSASAALTNSRASAEELRHSRAYFGKLEQARKRKRELEQRLREQGADTAARLALPK